MGSFFLSDSKSLNLDSCHSRNRLGFTIVNSKSSLARSTDLDLYPTAIDHQVVSVQIGFANNVYFSFGKTNQMGMLNTFSANSTTVSTFFYLFHEANFNIKRL